MPLSEHEQRLLDEIERALYAEDPKFATTVRQTDLKAHRKRRVVRAGVAFVAGVVLLVAGAMSQVYAVGVAGFVLMLVAGLVIARALSWIGRREGAEGAPPRAERKRRPESTRADGGLRERFHDRWNRRWDDRGER